MKLKDIYSIPEEIAQGEHSPAFGKFLFNWFGGSIALIHHELDLTFLEELTPKELEAARELIRRNLKLRYVHIIEGASALHDVGAAPILRAMLDDEPREDFRFVIAGALWKLTKDHVFIDCLKRLKTSAGTMVWAHLLKILWLDDQLAIDLLIDLLDHKDRMAAGLTLSILNQLECGHGMKVPPAEMPHQPVDYRRRRQDPAFREMMVAAIRKKNREVKNGA